MDAGYNQEKLFRWSCNQQQNCVVKYHERNKIISLKTNHYGTGSSDTDKFIPRNFWRHLPFFINPKQRTPCLDRERRWCQYFYERKAKWHPDGQDNYFKFSLIAHGHWRWSFHCPFVIYLYFLTRGCHLSCNHIYSGRRWIICRFLYDQKFRKRTKLICKAVLGLHSGHFFLWEELSLLKAMRVNNDWIFYKFIVCKSWVIKHQDSATFGWR